MSRRSRKDNWNTITNIYRGSQILDEMRDKINRVVPIVLHAVFDFYNGNLPRKPIAGKSGHTTCWIITVDRSDQGDYPFVSLRCCSDDRQLFHVTPTPGTMNNFDPKKLEVFRVMELNRKDVEIVHNGLHELIYAVLDLDEGIESEWRWATMLAIAPPEYL